MWNLRCSFQAATPEEIQGVKKPHGKDMVCTYFLGDNNMWVVGPILIARGLPLP